MESTVLFALKSNGTPKCVIDRIAELQDQASAAIIDSYTEVDRGAVAIADMMSLFADMCDARALAMWTEWVVKDS